MGEAVVHAIETEVGKAIAKVEPAQEPVPPTEDRAAQDSALIERDRVLRGLSKTVTKKDLELVDLRARLAAYELADAPQRVDRAPDRQEPSDRQELTEAIVKEITDAESKVNWKAEAERLAQELKAARVEQKYKHDPLIADLIRRGLPVEQLDDARFIQLLRQAQDTGEDTQPLNPVSPSRGQSQSDHDEALLRKTLWGEVR